MRCWCRAACPMRFGGWAAPAQPLPRGNVRDKAGQKSLCWCSWRTHGGCRRAAALPSDATVQQQQRGAACVQHLCCTSLLTGRPALQRPNWPGQCSCSCMCPALQPVAAPHCTTALQLKTPQGKREDIITRPPLGGEGETVCIISMRAPHVQP